MTDRRIWAVVPAAGSGRRFGQTTPKQYHPLAGRAVLSWTLGHLLGVERIERVAVALALEDRHWARLPEAGSPRILTVTGGAERIHSVLAGIDRLCELGAAKTDIVVVHDAARPGVRPDAIESVIEAALACDDGALLAMPVGDTLKRASEGVVEATLPREHVWAAQTPQAFPLGRLDAALRDAVAAGWVATDEAAAMERAGARPRLVEGGAGNLKLTRPGDEPLLAAILEGEAWN